MPGPMHASGVGAAFALGLTSWVYPWPPMSLTSYRELWSPGPSASSPKLIAHGALASCHGCPGSERNGQHDSVGQITDRCATVPVFVLGGRIDGERRAAANGAPTHLSLGLSRNCWVIHSTSVGMRYGSCEEGPLTFMQMRSGLATCRRPRRTTSGSFPGAFRRFNWSSAHTYRMSERTSSVLNRLFYRGRGERRPIDSFTDMFRYAARL